MLLNYRPIRLPCQIRAGPFAPAQSRPSSRSSSDRPPPSSVARRLHFHPRFSPPRLRILRGRTRSRQFKRDCISRFARTERHCRLVRRPPPHKRVIFLPPVGSVTGLCIRRAGRAPECRCRATEKVRRGTRRPAGRDVDDRLRSELQTR